MMRNDDEVLSTADVQDSSQASEQTGHVIAQSLVGELHPLFHQGSHRNKRSVVDTKLVVDPEYHTDYESLVDHESFAEQENSTNQDSCIGHDHPVDHGSPVSQGPIVHQRPMIPHRPGMHEGPPLQQNHFAYQAPGVRGETLSPLSDTQLLGLPFQYMMPHLQFPEITELENHQRRHNGRHGSTVLSCPMAMDIDLFETEYVDGNTTQQLEQPGNPFQPVITSQLLDLEVLRQRCDESEWASKYARICQPFIEYKMCPLLEKAKLTSQDLVHQDKKMLEKLWRVAHRRHCSSNKHSKAVAKRKQGEDSVL